jgi:predicted GTPase
MPTPEMFSSTTHTSQRSVILIWLGIFLFLPWLGLIGLGLLWLEERQWLWYGTGVIGATLLIGGIGFRWSLRGWKSKSVNKPFAAHWPHNTQPLWETIQQRARKATQQPELLQQPTHLQEQLLKEIQRVASHFHRDSSKALLEVPLPALLSIVERAAMELRRDLETHLPGAHLLTIHDLLRTRRLYLLGSDLYALYRALSFGLAPQAAILREIQGWFSSKFLKASRQEVSGWLLEALFERVGYYAIELYSGSVMIEKAGLQQYRSSTSAADLEQQQSHTESLSREPLRILILGHVNSGKSSLVNAMFGKLQAATDVLPLEQGLIPYLLEQDELPQALVLDSAGFGLHADEKLPEAWWKASRSSDVLLWVCAANHAARQTDKRLLDQLRDEFRQSNLPSPVLFVVLSKIDLLRPLREWEPPYDLEQAERPKAQSIRQALEAVAQDLEVPTESVIPVCLEYGKVYNVQEALIPSILRSLEESLRHKYLRCLPDLQSRQHWEQSWEQAREAGHLLAKGGLRLVRRAAHTVSEWEQHISR